MTKEILSRLDLIAAKLGQTAAELWPHAVRHTAIQCASNIGIWVFVFLGAVILMGIGLWVGFKKEWKEGPWIAPIAVSAVLCFALLLAASVSGADSIAGALEPTGHTVKAILRNR